MAGACEDCWCGLTRCAVWFVVALRGAGMRGWGWVERGSGGDSANVDVGPPKTLRA